MGKGKKASGKNYTSKGEHSNVSTSTKRLVRKAYMASPERMINQLAAHRKGKRTMVTIPNPDKEQTNKPFIRVQGKDFFKPLTNPNKKKENA